jgi:hypothetical protein
LKSGANYRLASSCRHYTTDKEAYNNDVKKVFIQLKQRLRTSVTENELDWFLKWLKII